MKDKKLIVGIAIAFVIGVLVGFSSGRQIDTSARFSIHVIARGAIKIDKRTGESWLMEIGSPVWKPITTSN